MNWKGLGMKELCRRFVQCHGIWLVKQIEIVKHCRFVCFVADF
jgi:hypothetical protein